MVAGLGGQMGGAQWIKSVKNLNKYFPQVCLSFIHIEVLHLEISKLQMACLHSALFLSPSSTLLKKEINAEENTELEKVFFSILFIGTI